MSSSDIAGLYDDMAAQYERWDWANRLFSGPLRKRAFGEARGRVLDVACGAGTNFRYLPGSAQLVGVDVSAEMVEAARAELDELRRGGTVYRMDAQDLQFPDDSFDTVISALSTCTFPDPVAALSEMARVCRPDGRVLLFEHGRSDVELLGRFQDWRADAHYEQHGCRWTQEPLAHFEGTELTVLESETLFAGMVTIIEARPAAD
ncbi:class I SAM-dependent methyltransferase [Haloarcula salinisoli]|uniref:Class I SAM-dependent methyltransferase n=1 Tax=Haloarcula salinisoli TaxID=2487746 RepID=A0A8J7YEQ9_9EURY|nr:class I SAM-dependent methyltransferase [Halomicroarcula salinisoli]MBX0286840.1 class I SAM-dependent methyltransferase [Halomicroarcula salinisoli]MBX0304142.1 class I SAM-dependent methyltransferase [Halomicroarcula salinisoli]